MTLAGIPKVTKEGKIDFHSCRVAFVTFVLEAGASVKEAQTLARHATPELTMNVYGRTRDARLSQVAERVGEKILNGGSIKYAERGASRNLTPLLPSSYMVEAAGIEPASEGASTCASTCVACPLKIRRPEPPQAGFPGSLGEIGTRLPDVSPASGDEARCRRLSHLAGGQW